MIELVRRLLAPLQRRVYLMIARGVIELVNDGLKCQALQFRLYDGELHEGVERFQQYGTTSHPHPGAELAVLFLGGNRSHGIAIAVEDRRYRLQPLAEGEVALYDDLGQKVHLKRDQVHVHSPSKVRIEGDVVEIVAHTTLRHDIHGYADDLTWLGDTTWRQSIWHDGATVTGEAHPIDPPEHFHGS